MPELNCLPYSYRSDTTVPDYDDSRALFVFDGICALCSGGARQLMRWDRHRRVNLTPTASELGKALFRHYGVDPNESYLLVSEGRGFTASAGYRELCRILGGAWRLLLVVRVVPESWRDVAYALVARNRYRWFGVVEHCSLLSPEQRARLL